MHHLGVAKRKHKYHQSDCYNYEILNNPKYCELFQF